MQYKIDCTCYKPVKTVEKNHRIGIMIHVRCHTATHYAIFRKSNLQMYVFYEKCMYIFDGDGVGVERPAQELFGFSEPRSLLKGL